MKLLLLSVLSGALMVVSYRPPEIPWTVGFFFVPLWYYWLKNPGYGKIFLSGWIAQFVFSAGAFYWLTITADLFYGAPGAQAYLYLFAFSCVAHISYPLAGVCWYYLYRKFALSQTQGLVVLVLLTTLADMLLPRIFPLSGGEPWMWSTLDVVQLSDIIGFTGLAGLTYALNAVWLGCKSPWRALGVNLGLMAVLCGLGYVNKLRYSDQDANLKAHLFQVNIDPIEVLTMRLGADEAMNATLETFFNEHRPPYQFGKPDLAIWSETAMPFDIAHESKYLTAFQNYVREQKIPILTGAYRYDEQHLKHNTAALFSADGQVVQTYDKHMLMPFGEFLPMENTFPFLRKLAPQIPTYGRGQDELPFVVGDARMGPSICYESLFPDHFRKLTANGANMFFNISGDYWFGNSTEAYFHGLAGLERAIEFRRPMIRVADTGITTAILADGTMLASPGIWEQWQDYVNIGYVKEPPRTFFDLYGQWWPWALASAGAGLLFSVGLRKVRTNRTSARAPKKSRKPRKRLAA